MGSALAASAKAGEIAGITLTSEVLCGIRLPEGEEEMRAKSLVKLPVKEPVKLEALGKFATLPKELKKSISSKDFKAAVVVDKTGAPKYFVFDTPSLWDILCAVDTKFEESVPAKEYVFHNPIGWLIDAIEARLPINPKLVLRLKKGITEAKRLGLVPFAKIKEKLELS